jgi:Gpi18-like mannosyltransferase
MTLKKQIDKKTLWKLILATTIILSFSYNAFSYDLFNYMFDAKIITHYHQNPYLHKALDFPGDPMLSFMHWTHRTYPYGPIWLLLTTPLSFLGANLFIPTFFLFKTLMAASFLGTAYYIGKILQKISPSHALLGVAFFSLNPLVIIESLVSGHLDIIMIFFATFALYKLLNKKYILSLILLAISIGIKFMTAALIPIFLLIIILQQKNKKIHWDLILSLALLFMTATVIYASHLSNFQPWYLLDIIFLAALLPYRFFITIPFIIIPIFALFNYLPFLYLGNWNPPVPQIISGLNIFSYTASLLFLFGYYIVTLRK